MNQKSRTTGAKDKKKRKRRAIEKHLFENYDADTFMAKENKITKEIANKLNMDVSEVKEAIAHPDFSPARHIKSVGPLDDVQLHSRTVGAHDKKKRKQRTSGISAGDFDDAEWAANDQFDMDYADLTNDQKRQLQNG